MKRILVTGGAGFIGSHLCKELLSRGNEVICIDNLYTGSKDNIADLAGNEKFEFIKHDITDPIMIEADQIYNLACPASPIHYQANPIKTIKCSALGVINMLGLAHKLGARILQASTSEVYGDPELHPQIESYWGNVNPVGVRSCYDEGKRVAETMCMDFHRQYGLEVRIIRIFNTYGPNMAENDGRVISNFIVQALKNQPITIYGSGEQTRSFQYVTDLIEGMIRMMEQDSFTGPVNVGNPGEYTILQLASKAIEYCSSSSEIVFKPLPSDDPKRRKPDITLARKILNGEPVVSLDQGLKVTAEYFRKKIAAAAASTLKEE